VLLTQPRFQSSQKGRALFLAHAQTLFGAQAVDVALHQPIPEQGQWLAQVARGFFAYHAVPTNFPALRAFHHHVTVSWLCTLQRRSQKDRTTWQRIAKIRLLAAYCG
jgi:hypothetical protein